MLANQLPLPPQFLWQVLLLQLALVALYQPALPVWNTLLFLLLLGWQAWRSSRQRAAFTARQVNWLLAPILLLLLLQIKQLGMLNLMLHILLLAAVGRNFTLNQRKDAAQLIWIHYFAVTCSFIFYQQIAWALAIISLLGLNLYLQHRLFSASEVKLQPRRLAQIFITTLPVWLGLFLLFPRLPPLWQMPNQNIASSGLSDSLDPGSIERLVQSDALAFRASFQTARPAREEWYWRAKVYEDFDGRSWQINTRFSAPQRAIAPPPATTEVLQYQLLVEPHHQRDLFSLGYALSWSDPLKIRPAGLIAYPTPVAQRISYQLSSVLQAIPLASSTEQQLNLRQHSANPQTRRFGQELANQYRNDPKAIVQALASHFQQQNFYYSLTPPRLGNNAVDQFLFESRIGFCSHYASATAVILRAAGIPARVVGGYQGGDWQENQQYLLVRQRDAHAWVEYLLDNSWQRFDPTAAIAPERILAGLEQTLSLNERALLNGWQDNWLGKLAMQWSHLDYFWSVWVLGFNQADQQRLWQQFTAWPHWFTLLLSVLIATAIALAWLGWLYWPKALAPSNRLRQQLCKALASEPERGATVSSWLQDLASRYPEHAKLFNELRTLYVRSVFANDEQATRLFLQRLKQQQQALKRLRKTS